MYALRHVFDADQNIYLFFSTFFIFFSTHVAAETITTRPAPLCYIQNEANATFFP